MEQRDANLKFRAFLVYLRSANLTVLSIFHNHLVYEKDRIKITLDRIHYTEEQEADLYRHWTHFNDTYKPWLVIAFMESLMADVAYLSGNLIRSFLLFFE